MTTEVALSGPDWRFQAKLTVPTGPMRFAQALPLVRALADTVVKAAAKASEDKGEKISCKAGCGACCRQLVPISEIEARRIGELVEAMPEPRRTEIRARFADDHRRLEEAGLLDRLLHHENPIQGQMAALGIEYFRHRLPCPFLENESCSIYAERPLACREYLVTSPAEHCANPTPETVHGVKQPFWVWTALARLDEGSEPDRFLRWVPLVLAPEWADANPDRSEPLPGPELVQKLIEKLAGQDVPPPPVWPAVS
jgi:Fe-S-cluster containining protein